MRILIVEDQLEAVRPLTMLLGVRGHETEVATTVAEALEVLDHHGAAHFSAILTDLQLPDGSGRQVAHAVGPHPCVVAVTGHVIALDSDEPFTHHLRKPVDFDALLSILAEQESSDIDG